MTTPNYIIDLQKHSRPIEIAHVMKSLDIKCYGYAFVTDECVLKYGESSDHSHTYGERIYRQAAHLPGWSQRHSSNSGADMRCIAEDFQKKYSRDLHKDTVRIEIYVAQDKTQAQALERSLIQNSIDHHGRPPMGNRDRVTRFQHVRANNVSQLNQFFDGVID